MDTSNEHIRATYDDVPYACSAIMRTFPDSMRAAAALAGFDAAPAERCRVLEIGCALGRNLLPMAQTLPESRFLGFDLSPVQIEIGLAEIRQSGLSNVELRCQDMMNFGPQEGVFDYIIAHGIYSWVPAPVRQRLLEICKNNLAPGGLAYVSYSVLPGEYLRGIVRDLLRFHARNEQSAKGQVEKAREILEFAAHVSPGRKSYKEAVATEVSAASRTPDWYLLHDQMSPINQPFYFKDFVSDAAEAGLRYVTDAAPTVDGVQLLPLAVQQKIRAFSSDPIEVLQYVDFINGQTFRASLLCHAGAPRLSDDEAMVLKNLHFASNAVRQNVRTPTGQTAIQFNSMTTSHQLTTPDPGTIRALDEMKKAWPGTVPFSQLLEPATAVRENIGDQNVDQLARNLMSAYRAGIVEAWTRPVNFIAGTSEKPRASPIARALVGAGNQLVNLRHQAISVDPVILRLLPLLDGSRSRLELRNELEIMVREGKVRLKTIGPKPTTAEMDQTISAILEDFAANSLLIPG